MPFHSVNCYCHSVQTVVGSVRFKENNGEFIILLGAVTSPYDCVLLYGFDCKVPVSQFDYFQHLTQKWELLYNPSENHLQHADDAIWTTWPQNFQVKSESAASLKLNQVKTEFASVCDSSIISRSVGHKWSSELVRNRWGPLAEPLASMLL